MEKVKVKQIKGVNPKKNPKKEETKKPKRK